MPAPILATKLHAPSHRPGLVPRPRLIEKLDEGRHRKLTLISAPAGFGKSTLAGEWIAARGRPSAWLSLDEGDGDLPRFLVYLVAALQTVQAGIGAKIPAALPSNPRAPIEPVLTSLVNDINAIPDDFILVLDDYHALDSRLVDDALSFLLEHLPPRMHLVIATREDPNLPLAKWRARDQLSELRAADLRFTITEAATFLNRTMGLELPEEHIAALENRTEGWIAGLHMAALSMRGRPDLAGFIQSFTGSHRFVLDYLLEEVLQRQSERVRGFLRHTAILDGLSGPLCDAVTGRGDGAEMLEVLERENLFVIPLDDDRRWYRYHHLFADVLKAHLGEAEPGRASTLHRRASEWYQQNGMTPDAISHALAAGDFERAAGLIELAGPAMEGGPEAATWLGWVKALPDELVRARPALSVWYSFALLGRAEMEAAESRLNDAERLLATPPAGMIVDERQFRSLLATIATARAYRAQSLGDIAGTVRYARQVLDLLPDGEHRRRDQATGLLGLACWASGDLEAASRVFADYNAKLQAAGNIADAIGTAFVLADIRVAQGHLREAASTLARSLRFVVDQGEPLPPDTADLYRGLSELDLERGDLESAARNLSRSRELRGQAELLDRQHRLCIAEARMKQVQGAMDDALALLNEAERLHIKTPLPVVRPIAAMKARIWIAQGRLAEVISWARERGLSVGDDLSYQREFEHLTLARLLVARHRNDADDSLDAAGVLLERLLRAAEAGGRMGSVIEIRVLQALTHEARDDIPAALASLEQALILAEPEGYCRIFVDEGSSMERLLTRLSASRDGGTPGLKAYVAKLLAAFQQPTPSRTSPGTNPVPLVEPLSERERDVMRLLGTELKGPEIARALFISLNTLRTHTKSIFSKLGAHNRRTAVRRAKELGLL